MGRGRRRHEIGGIFRIAIGKVPPVALSIITVFKNYSLRFRHLQEINKFLGGFVARLLL